MKLITLIATRNKSCHVKTMHSVLRLNLKCLQGGHSNEIVFVQDDPFDKGEAIQNVIKHKQDCDRLLFIDFGIHVDDGSLSRAFETYEGCGVLVFPGVTEGVDWNQFRESVKNNVDEPDEQKGLNFDTVIGNRKIADDVFAVDSTTARCWVANVKTLRKKIDRVSPGGKMFEKFKEAGVKVYAYVNASLTMTYAHECYSNILNAAGVKAN